MLNSLIDMSKKIIIKRLISHERDNFNNNSNPMVPTDMIDILINKEDGELTFTGIIANCITFIQAGNLTSSSGISWLVYYMAKHQDIQDKLRREINEHMPALDDKTDINLMFEQVQKLD